MDATVGFITLNYVDKSLEMLIAYAAIAFGGMIVLINLYLKRQYLNSGQIKYPINDEVITFSVLSVALFVGLSQITKTSPITYVASFALAWVAQKKLLDNSEKLWRVATLIFLPYCLLLIKLVVSTHYFPSIAIIVVVFTVFLWRCGAEAFAIAVLVFLTKYFYSGTFEVVDTFHNAEHFLAAMEAHKGYFAVFPNLGYLEEYPAYALVLVLKFLTNGHIQMSIGTMRFLLWPILFLIIFSQIYRRDKLLAVLFMIALPVDRISLLISLAYASFICANHEKALINNQQLDKFSVVLLSLFPLLAIGLTPSYLLFPLLALIGMLPLVTLNHKQLIIIIVMWVVLSAVFNSQLTDYIIVYAELSRLYDVAYSTSISVLNRWDLGFWLILLLVVSVVASGIAQPSDSVFVKAVKLLGALLIIIKCADYGFGRIDPGFSRLVPAVIAAMLVASFFSKRFNGIIAILLSIIIVAYLQFELPRKLEKPDFSLNNAKNQPVQLNSKNTQLAKAIGEFADGRQVINYSTEPALTLGIPNSIATPFTSPFVTLGEKNQKSIVEFLKANPKAIVYLGHDFNTFDGIDVRLRVPLIFRYLADNYIYANVKGNVYAVPNLDKANDLFGKIFFDQLDMRRSPIYYTNYAAGRFNYRKITIDCIEQKPGRYKIINEGNTLLGDFQCGINYVPEVFFWGDTKDIQSEK